MSDRAPQPHYTVAVYPPGDSFARVLIPALAADSAEQACLHARTCATEAIAALRRHAPQAWRTTVVSASEVADAPFVQPSKS